MPSPIWLSASGNDSNSGTTSSDPKLTIGAALSAVTAGGIIYVLPGSHATPPNGGIGITKSVTIEGLGPQGDIIFETNNTFGSIGPGISVTLRNLLFRQFVTAFYISLGGIATLTLEDCGFWAGNFNYSGAFIVLSGNTTTQLTVNLLRCTVLGYPTTYYASVGQIRVIANQVLYSSSAGAQASFFRSEQTGGLVVFPAGGGNNYYVTSGGSTPRPPLEGNSVYNQAELPNATPPIPYGYYSLTAYSLPALQEVILSSESKAPEHPNSLEVTLAGQSPQDIIQPVGLHELSLTAVESQLVTEPFMREFTLTQSGGVQDVPELREMSLAARSAQDLIQPVSVLDISLSAVGAADIVQPVDLVEVTLAGQPQAVPGSPMLSEFALTVSDATGKTLFTVQPEGPADGSQTPGRMRHGKFFRAGKLRRVNTQNRRKP